MKITITEALSEINLIKKKIESKRSNISGNLLSFGHLPDPMATNGGSAAYIKAETQGLEDLQKRLVNIRRAIAEANLKHEITIAETTGTIFDWLTWNREISTDQTSFTKKVHQTVKTELDKVGKQPQVYKDADGNNKIVEVRSNINLQEWLKKEESLSTLKEQLDGKLSLKNATILIDI